MQGGVFERVEVLGVLCGRGSESAKFQGMKKLQFAAKDEAHDAPGGVMKFHVLLKPKKAFWTAPFVLSHGTRKAPELNWGE